MIGLPSHGVTPQIARNLAAAGAPGDAEVMRVLGERGITEVLHFTTNLGLIGTLASGSLLSRARLPKERYLEHVYRPNAEIRKDPAWLDFVNLSISRINDWMFDTSDRWHVHEDLWWVALSFNPIILADPGVVFATTNNIYPAVRRGIGVDGLEALFADEVTGRYGELHDRTGLPANWPTDRQAEALYPFQVNVASLQHIYVREEDALDETAGVFGGLLPTVVEVPVTHAPEVFE